MINLRMAKKLTNKQVLTRQPLFSLKLTLSSLKLVREEASIGTKLKHKNQKLLPSTVKLEKLKLKR